MLTRREMLVSIAGAAFGVMTVGTSAFGVEYIELKASADWNVTSSVPTLVDFIGQELPAYQVTFADNNAGLRTLYVPDFDAWPSRQMAFDFIIRQLDAAGVPFVAH